MTAESLFRQRVRASLLRNREVFAADGHIAQMHKDLLGLSASQLHAILPRTTAEADYTNLISVVKEATRLNISQAELRGRIESLGEGAISIAKSVSSLAKIFTV